MRYPIGLTATAAAMLLVSACGSDSTAGDSTMPDNTDPRPSDPAEADASPEEPSVTDPAVADESESDAASTTEPVATEPVATEPQPPEPVPTEPIATEPPTTEPVSSAPDAEPPVSTLERLGALAATDLSQRLGVDVASVDIVDVEEVTWSDASLGCPQKDFQYAQVLTPGVRIVLTAQDSTYTYHGGSNRDPFYCVDPQQPV